ncbi:hypothetical protein R80B4_02172 [Fibrobacteres bacterium R8-0-B4]
MKEFLRGGAAGIARAARAAAVLAAAVGIVSGAWAQGRAVGGFAPKHTHGRAGAADVYEMTAKNLSADKNKAGYGESFYFSADVVNAGDGKFPGGQIGAALVDGRGAVVEIVGVENHFGAIRPDERIRVNIRCSVSEGAAAPGRQYRLTVVVRAKGGEWESVSGRGGVPAVDFSVASRSPAPAAAAPVVAAPVAPPVAAAPSVKESGGGNAKPAPKDEPSERAGNKTADADWDLKKLDAARNVSYMTDLEKDVVLEINKARSDPKKYAEQYIKPILQYCVAEKCKTPDGKTYAGSEGAALVQELIDALNNADGAVPLVPEKGLYLAAKDHAADQGSTGEIGHEGSDGSTPFDRMAKYCGRGASAENISYSKSDGREYVIRLLLDAGTPKRGHRKNIMNGTYNQIGVATGPHKVYGMMCVMDFAKDFKCK